MNKISVHFKDGTEMQVPVDDWKQKLIEMTQLKGYRIENDEVRNLTVEDIERLSFANPELIAKFTTYAYGDLVDGWSLGASWRNQ